MAPSIQKAEKVVFSDRIVDQYHVFKPPRKNIDAVKTRVRCGNSVYQHPMVHQHEGEDFVPRLDNHFGQRYSVQGSHLRPRAIAAKDQIRWTSFKDLKSCSRQLMGSENFAR